MDRILDIIRHFLVITADFDLFRYFIVTVAVFGVVLLVRKIVFACI